MPREPKVSYSFGDCVLDPQRRELRLGATVVDVEPQVFDLLELLIVNRERVVSVDEIIDAIWGGKAVSNSAVSGRIRDARRTIRDDGKRQQFIQTKHRRGFRFVGKVQERSPNQARAPDAPERHSIANRLPAMPAPLIGRDDDLTRLKARFGIPAGNPRQPVTVVRGWPGVGKTSLVNALAYDPEVANVFPDGILWAALGESPNPLGELMAWARTLGAPATGSGGGVEGVTFEVRSLLHNRQVLLIVDDVWDVSAAVPFRVGGPRCATLITTRSVDVADELAIAPGHVYPHAQLDETAGLQLLARLAPSLVEEHRVESRQLVADLEGLPLALRVAGRLLNAEARLGWDSVKELLAELSASSRLLSEVAPEDRYDPRTDTTPTVSLLLRRSTDRLDTETRNRFAYLSSFAAKPATFALDAMLDVWRATDLKDAKKTARILINRGLLEPIGTGRFQMHALLVLHARSIKAK
jgi:DNA-binding winged helix-turn-helix (wHTH) protein